jgi:hypothetical protein
MMINYFMKEAVNLDDEKLEFTLEHRKSRRVGPTSFLMMTSPMISSNSQRVSRQPLSYYIGENWQKPTQGCSLMLAIPKSLL